MNMPSIPFNMNLNILTLFGLGVIVGGIIGQFISPLLAFFMGIVLMFLNNYLPKPSAFDSRIPTEAVILSQRGIK